MLEQLLHTRYLFNPPATMVAADRAKWKKIIIDRKMLVKVISAAFVGVLFPLGYTLVLLLVGQPPSEVKGSFTRITGPFSQSNTFARYLAFMIVFGVALYPSLSRRQRQLMVPVLALSSTFLLMTLTRGAILATVVSNARVHP